jgi:lysophospholipid acyltransferase (LPLAT)-like uncharacterized protein
MKVRSPLMIRLTALGLSFILRAWLGSLSFRTRFDDRAADPLAAPRRGIYLFWHETLIVATHHAQQGFSVLTSQHADGELIAQVVRMLGGRAVRGSTKKAALTALREMLRAGRVRHIGITPDGPRGPRRVLQQGAIYIASKTGMPLIPVGFALRDCWRHRSWDRMAIPKPGTLAVELAGRPIDVPPDLDRDALEQYRLRVQAAMDEVQSRAEAMATADDFNRLSGSSADSHGGNGRPA